VALAFQHLSGNAPGYLTDDCQLVADARVRQLRSADTQTLVVSRTRSSFGDRTFAAAGPQVWNSLPPSLRLLWAVIRPVQAVTGNTFIRTVRSRHSVNCFNSLIATLKPQSNGPSYSNAVIGTLAVDGWAVTFGTARRGLGGAAARPGPSLLYQM